MPCLFAAAKDRQQVMYMSRIRAERRCKPRVAKTKIGVVGISHLIFKGVRVGQRVLAVGDNGHIFHAVAVKVGGDYRRGKLCWKRKSIAELLFYRCRQLCRVNRRWRCGPRLAGLW